MSVDKNSKKYEVDIPMHGTCDCCVCTASGFKTDYPPVLQNYIHPSEFDQSITNINNSFPKSYYSCTSFIAILFLIALGLTALGIVMMVTGFSERQRQLGLIIGACIIIILGCGICFFSCRCYINQIESVASMRLVVEEESKKYEERHCQWRLIAKKDDPGFLGSRRHQVAKFHVIIDINPTNTDIPTMVRSDFDHLASSQLDNRLDEQQRLTAYSPHQV